MAWAQDASEEDVEGLTESDFVRGLIYVWRSLANKSNDQNQIGWSLRHDGRQKRYCDNEGESDCAMSDNTVRLFSRRPS